MTPGGAPAAPRSRRRDHLGDWLVVISLLAVIAIPLRGLLRAQGPPMEEGFMLAFPEFVLHGLRPNADFLHLYGPGSLWALAGVYRVFGVSLATERWFALLQQLGQSVQGLRPEHHVHVGRPLDYGLAFLARHAATDADDHAAPRGLELTPAAELREEFFLRLLADRAGVEQQEIGPVGTAHDVAERPVVANEVWSYDFVFDHAANGQQIKCLTVVDEGTAEVLAIDVAGSIRSRRVIEVLSRLVVECGPTKVLRSDNGPEFVSKDLDYWAWENGVKLQFSRPGKSTDNAHIESFNGKLRDELLNGEIFDTLLEAQIVIEGWRKDYNTKRPHSSLGYRPPAPEALLPSWANQLDPSQGNYQIRVGT